MGKLLDEIRANSKRIQLGYNQIKGVLKEEQKQADLNKERDIKYWKSFKKAVKNKNYFVIDDVDAFCRELKIDYDVLFILGKKNIGKTRQIYKLFSDAVNAGEKVVYGRMSQTELMNNFNDFNGDAPNPLLMKNSMGSTLLVSKENESQICGKAIDFKYCQKAGGGEFADYSKIIFDEVISYDPRNTFNDNHMRNWSAFVSTVTRNKTGVKVYLFGNLLDSSNLDLLEFYGIDRSDDFRYIVRNPANPCRILFINLRELYKGIEKQTGAVQHMSAAYAAALTTNTTLLPSDKIIADDQWKQFDPWSAFVWFGGESPLLIQINKSSIEESRPIAIKVSVFKPFDELVVDILSDDAFLAMQYPNIKYCPSLQFLYEELYYKTVWKNIYFFSPFALMTVQEIYNTVAPTIECLQLGRSNLAHLSKN